MSDDVRLTTHVAQMQQSVELAMSYVDGLSQANSSRIAKRNKLPF